MLQELKMILPGQVVWDRGEKASVKGLLVRATSDDRKMFYFYYRTRDGQQRKPKIGELGDITLTEARRRAKVLSDRVVMGEDPKGLWEEKRAELTLTELFGKAWNEYWLANERFARSGWGSEVRRMFTDKISPTFGRQRLSEITPVMVRQWHAAGSATPYAANRQLEVLKKLLNFAEQQGLRNPNSNPCHLVKPHPEKSRKRYATAEEIQRISPLLEKYSKTYPADAAFLYLLLFTGSRPRAIERATWDQLREFEVDGKIYGLLTFYGKSTSTTGQDEQVVIPPQAMHALNRLPRIEGMTITGVKTPRNLWEKIRAEAKCEDLWIRDLRRTFATVGMSNGVSIGAIGELLNHHTSETTKIYAKLTNTAAIAAVTSIANRMEGLLSVQTSA